MNRWDINDPLKGGLVKKEWISDKVNQETVDFAKKFGDYLAKTDSWQEIQRDGTPQKMFGSALTTSQLRRFFGEVKRQQTIGYKESTFVMLSPKLAYAVGRARKDKKQNVKYCKIEDFFAVFDDAIKKVGNSDDKQKAFKNFISIFEAIVAYHKAAEKTN